MARIFDRKLAVTYRALQAAVLLGYLLGWKIAWQKVRGCGTCVLACTCKIAVARASVRVRCTRWRGVVVSS
jgi:hypothetical protein